MYQFPCRALAASLALICVAATASNASATAPARFMTMGAPHEAPVAFLKFCQQLPAECGQAVTAAEASPTGEALIDGLAAPPAPRLSLAGLDAALREDEAPSALTTAAILPEQGSAPVQSDFVAPEWGRASAPAVQPLVLDKPMRKLIDRVNRRLNRDIRPMSDLASSGQFELWSLPVEHDGRLYGDCEDYALAKKHALVAAGLPAAALSLAVVQRPSGDVHAVLIVATDAGEYVLDNLSDKLKPWTGTRYKWLMRQVAGDSLEWTSPLQPLA